MIKKIGWMFLIITSIASTAAATAAVSADQDTTKSATATATLTDDLSILDLEHLDPIIEPPLPPDPEPSWWFKLRLLKEYLLLQAELAKQHIIDHQQAYLVASTLVALGVIATGSAAYLVHRGDQQAPVP
jgi:hypothetical protein